MKKLLWLIIILVIIGGGYLLLNSAPPSGVEESIISDVSDDHMEDDDQDNNENGHADDEDDDHSQSDLMTEEGDAASSSDRAMIEEAEELSGSLTSFTFEGFAPGKSHVGTFEVINVSEVEVKNGMITGGTVAFDTASVKTDSEGLDKHLCADDFFNCETFPTATFTLSNVSESDDNTYSLTGTLDFHGIQKEISFSVTQSGDSQYNADFTLDTTPFGMKYIGVNKDVRIQFTGNIN